MKQSGNQRRSGKQRSLRVVLDTNVVLSALVFNKGVTAQLRVAWQRGDYLPLVITETVQELMRVLAYPKFRLDRLSQQELLSDYLPYTQVVRIPEVPPVVPACRDPDDLPFLMLAAAAKADTLVTGDTDLQMVAGKVGYAIMAPDAFLDDVLLRLERSAKDA
jgi:putative PIN family toxin of toxin-antitoxin system